MIYFTQILKTILISLLGFTLTSSLLAQVTLNEFTIPPGWEETEAWLPKFQAAFGTDANYGEFFSIMSESDFLLTHSENHGFIFVWQEDLDSKSNNSRKLSPEKNDILTIINNQISIEEIIPTISIKSRE